MLNQAAAMCSVGHAAAMCSVGMLNIVCNYTQQDYPHDVAQYSTAFTTTQTYMSNSVCSLVSSAAAASATKSRAERGS